MFYITGDTHGDFSRYIPFTARAKPTENDVMIILGDVGLNYYKGKKDEQRKKFVNDFPFTTFCIHGNHEMRPTDIESYETKLFCGGTVWYEEKYPKILFAKDGEIYRFGEYDCIVIGGAYSVDKYYRLMNGWSWFENEQPTAEIKAYIDKQFESRNNKVDIVLSHTCPLKYQPTEVFLKGLDQSTVDKSTEQWLDTLENRIDYSLWYCGHYHTEKKIDKLRFMYESISML